MFLVILFVYLYSSIPFSLFIGKSYGVDIRNVGSGNVGASNLGRNCGKKAFLLAMFLDGTKGAFAVLVGYLFMIHPLILFPIALLGHGFSIFINFKGGKGVATSFGFVLAYTPLLSIFAILVFLIILKVTKYVSLSSVSAIFFYSILAFTFVSFYYGLFCFICFLVILFLHLSNMKKIIKGKENKITLM